MRTLSNDSEDIKLHELIEAARETPLFVPILLGVRCGLRRGEVVALHWRNVDLERGQISVVASAERRFGLAATSAAAATNC